MKKMDLLTKENINELMQKLNIKNIYCVPRIEKIVLSSSSKDLITNKKLIDDLENQLAIIAAQKPKITYAKKSIANFKLRENSPIGVKVTLRRDNMNEFYYKLINIICPRIRDFQGFSEKGFDSQGNYNLGIKEQIFFPEIDYDKIKKTWGVNISIITSAKNKKGAYELLKILKFPFRKK